MPRGSLYIWLNRDDDTIRRFESYRPIFERLRDSFLPPPATMTVGSRKPSKIAGYDAPQLAKALDRGNDNVTIVSADESLEILLWPLNRRTAIAIYCNPAGAGETRDLFLRLSEAIRPTYGRCHLLAAMETLNRERYTTRRTFYSSGLYWLNVFGPEEEARQGGAALGQNPFAEVERYPYGLVLQVCGSPEEAATPEGVERLIQATNAMPPLPGEEPAPAAESRTAADHISIAGTSGFYEPASGVFWITKNIVPAAPLDARSIETIRRVKESRQPPVSQVRVLFSLREAAETNNATLEGLAESWYVSAQTGQPEKV